MNQLQISEMTFALDCRTQPNGTGSPISRFFGRLVNNINMERGGRDMYIDKAHMALDIFPFAVFLHSVSKKQKSTQLDFLKFYFP